MFRTQHNTYLHPKELNRKTRTFVSILINDFGLNLISIFIPIFLYIEGFSLGDIALFHIVLFASRIVSTHLAARVAGKVGPSRALQIAYVSALVAIGAMVAITSSENLNYALLMIAAFANGLFQGLYSIARHVNIEMLTTSKNAGSTIGWIRIFENVVLALSPLVGGIIATTYGVSAALVVSFTVIAISLLYVVGESNESRFMYNKHRKITLHEMRYDIIANITRGYDGGVSRLAWPLFIYIIVGQMDRVGAVSTLSMLILLPFMVWVAKNSDKKGSQMLTWGTVIRVIIYPFRALITGFTGAVGVNITSEFGDAMSWGGHMQHYYKRADILGRLRYTYVMEMSFPIGAIIAWTVIGGLSLMFETSDALQLSFLSAVFVVPFVVLFNRVNR